MNRMEEYQALMEELERGTPALENTLERACQKKKRRDKKVIRSISGLAVCFTVFVLLVNFSAPVAYACSRVPILKELAAAVTFSQSLSDAVENEYVQPISLSKTENDITVSVEYLIVDQKQVNVFYRLDSEVYPELEADPEILMADGTSPMSCGYHSNGFGQENGELRSLTIDFVDDDVPDSLCLKLQVYNNAAIDPNTAPENASNSFYSDIPELPDYIAQPEFLLEFDPQFTAAGKIYQVGQTVELDGQQITITDIGVYPTHMRINITEDQENTAWLKNLKFYIESDFGMRFDAASNGITATGSADSKSMVSYRADSSYFYKAESLKLVITGAKWLNKDMERMYLNLVTGESGPIPEGTEFMSAERDGDGWIVTFKTEYREDEPMTQLFGNSFYDEEGNVYEINMWSAFCAEWNEAGKCTYYCDQFPLKKYPYDEVWLSPIYSHEWTAKDQIIVNIQ